MRLQGEPRLIGESSNLGIVAHSKTWNRAEIKSKLSSVEFFQAGFSESAHWPYYKKVSLFRTPTELESLFDEAKRQGHLKEISAKPIELAKACKDGLVAIQRVS